MRLGVKAFMVLKVCSVQTHPINGEVEKNLKRVEEIVESVPAAFDLLLLPELFSTGYFMDQRLLDLIDRFQSLTVTWLEKKSKQWQVFVAAGIGRRSDDHYHNALALIDRGAFKGYYDKTHLFRDEKRFFSPGGQLAIAEISGVKVGFFLCYEIGFPEIHRAYTKEGVQLLAGSFAFGKLRSRYYDVFSNVRPIENGVFLATSCLCGSYPDHEFNGHSRIVTPNGTILADALDKEGWILGSIDSSVVHDYQTREEQDANAYLLNLREGVTHEIRVL